MAEFKPMVKMETTEPSVVLKLKKGGHVNMKKGGSADGHKKMADGGAMGMLASTPAFVGRPAVNAPVRSPGKPSAADRMKAQKSMTTKTVSSPKSAKAPMKQISKQEVMVNRTEGMKDGGKTEVVKKGTGGFLRKAFGGAKKIAPVAQMASQVAKATPTPAPTPLVKSNVPMGKAISSVVSHMQKYKKEGGKVDMAQDKAMIKKAFKQHDTQEHKGGKGTNLKLKSGGVSMGNGGGYKNGGNVPAEKDRSPTKTLKTPNKKVSTAKTDPGYERYATGGVAKSNAGGFATGGVAMSNAGGFKNGGASKKHYATGGIVNTGKPVAMPQGNQPVPAPKTQQNFSGTYKKGGKVENTRLRNALDTQNAPDMKNAKLDDNLKYPKTMNSPQKAPKFV
jgi:hypothetical protein